MDVELLVGPQCPHAAAARSLLTACLRRLSLDIQVRERVGAYPSPTILVDGVDVMTARPGAPARQACRLDVPTAEAVLAALRPPTGTVHSGRRGMTGSPGSSARQRSNPSIAAQRAAQFRSGGTGHHDDHDPAPAR